MSNDKKSTGFFNNWIVRNVLLAAAMIFIFVMLTTLFLSLITRHNKEVVVPDFSNMSFKEAQKLASSSDLKVEVTDSMYVRRLKPGVVYEQSPAAGAKVKPGRKIQLTTCTYNAEEVPMPSLVGFSMRQAKAELLRNGLQLGKLIYVEDIATNNVLGQRYRGREISAGTMITSGSVIDLLVGLNPADNMTIVPDLNGKDYLRAIDLILESSLNVGRVKFESSIRTYADSVNAVVSFQNPSKDSDPVPMGTEVSVSLRAAE